MNKDIVFVKTNKHWREDHLPLVTVITSNYNRREILLRCMRSVDAQSFKDIEYIIVDNGSSVSFDDIMDQFMVEASIPVMFVKRNNGIGRQTGRNSAIRRARGTYISMIDSDDEYLPDAIEKLVNAWNGIPADKHEEYREVVALCQDEHGTLVGIPFPDGINELSHMDSLRACMQPGLHCEHVNMSRTILLKENLFPEPEGVANYSDAVVWWKLSKKYKSYFFNDILRIYYTESKDSITNAGKNGLNIIDCIGQLWTNQHYLNNWNYFIFPFIDRVRSIVFYNIFKNLLKSHGKYPKYAWTQDKLKGFVNNSINIILWLPSKFITNWYIHKHGDFI